MSACRDQDESLTLFAAGALEPEEEARVRAHLESCAACRSEAEAHRDVLGLAALPPPSAREQAVMAALPRTAVGTWRREQVQKAARMRTTGALLAAAAVVLFALGPVVQRRVAPPAPLAPQVETPASVVEETESELEQWALTDPLSDALELSYMDLEDAEDVAGLSELELEELLSSPIPGETL
ncbi:zf-HC2 domain-containing protein [Archangium violaceum]|uniref:anti-sigma factor family protein n=1 Tax=Archangium violaceum TaxID=83451 RepID=UPI00193B05C3|nr:zf-HC2 domain-containing protein [Archangium violaceum]QRK04519.1 zf-HC2 domain-containing protein [Archangium violaceum]